MHLSDEDKKLWLAVNKDTKKLINQHMHSSQIVNTPKAKISKEKPQPPVAKKKDSSDLFKSAALIDLHGKTIQDAHNCIRDFILFCYRRNKKNILVITGQGNEFGSIKREFQFWLEEDSVKKYISSVNEAHPQHGGAGAYYVVLKSQKNKSTSY